MGQDASVQAAEPGYRVIKKIPLGGEGGWDYLTCDPSAHRLYISRGTHVVVMDTDTDKVVGEVANTPGVHGIALAPELNRGFTSNGREGTVTVFDLKTLRELDRIKVGRNPDAILYDSASGRVFTFNGGSKDATAIDAVSGKVVGTVPLGGKPETGVADGQGQVYVNVENTGEVVRLDAQKLQIKDRWKLAPDKDPTGLAIDCKNHRLFASCHSQHMVVLEAESGKVLARPAIGRGTDACVYDPEAGLAFSSNGDGTLTVVQESRPGEFEAVDNVKTQPSARTMALDTKTHQIYLAAARRKPGGGRGAIEPNSFVIVVVGK